MAKSKRRPRARATRRLDPDLLIDEIRKRTERYLGEELSNWWWSEKSEVLGAPAHEYGVEYYDLQPIERLVSLARPFKTVLGRHYHSTTSIRVKLVLINDDGDAVADEIRTATRSREFRSENTARTLARMRSQKKKQKILREGYQDKTLTRTVNFRGAFSQLPDTMALWETRENYRWIEAVMVRTKVTQKSDAKTRRKRTSSSRR